MSLSIRMKMLYMGIGVFAVVLILLGISQYIVQSTRSAVHVSRQANELRVKRFGQLEILHGFELKMTELTLNAMDAIVDKGEGKISDERMGEIKTNAQWLTDHLGDIDEAADTDEEKTWARELASVVNTFIAEVEVNLPKLISSRASEEEFSKVDDVLDASSGKIVDTLGKFMNSVRDEVKEAQEHSTKAEINLKDRLANAQLISWSFGISMAVLCLVVFYIFARSILGPLAKGVAFADALRAGDLSSRLRLSNADEIGKLAASLDSAADALADKAQLAKTIADGDLTSDVSLASNRDALGQALQQMVADLRSMVAQVNDNAGSVASSAQQISSASQSLSQQTTEQAASIEEISSTLTEVASQSSTNAQNAEQAQQLSGHTRAVAEKGFDRMKTMVDAMGEITDHSEQVSKIIKVIDDIAFQTNLLALNAAVEAARAGRHGKGFAVVAEEVRNLAGRSAKAAKETQQLIEATVVRVTKGTEIANNTYETLQEIMDLVVKTTDLVSEIAAASKEQSTGVDQINQGVNQMETVTQQNSANAEETASAAHELNGLAGQLKQMLGQFKIDSTMGSSAIGNHPPMRAPIAPPNVMPAAPKTNLTPPTPPSRSVPPSRPAVPAPPPPAPAAAPSSDDTPQIVLDDDEWGKY